MKIKPPRQVQEWSCSSRWESIDKALSSPARMAGTVCANVDQIRRQGRWNNITMNGAYLTNLPRELVRSMAGFLTYGRFFYVARAALDRPTGLCKKFPGDPIQHTVAENAFVQVIKVFRKTFIQDSVLMMELHPCYPIWQHSIFSDSAYLSFERDLLQIEVQEHDPAHTLLQQCVPMHSGFQTPIGYKIFFLPALLFCSGWCSGKDCTWGREDRGFESHNPTRHDLPRQLLQGLLFKV
ncbi:hypothetical protein [Absidia glauca]|uniref:Ndc10 domain-containing protein n=1 Tax=Absidia glauca TaxID=4829 RepID=A0A168QIU0_ABSGL|nr:hypothetical protein [Absidia glauca]